VTELARRLRRTTARQDARRTTVAFDVQPGPPTAGTQGNGQPAETWVIEAAGARTRAPSDGRTCETYGRRGTGTFRRRRRPLGFTPRTAPRRRGVRFRLTRRRPLSPVLELLPGRWLVNGFTSVPGGREQRGGDGRDADQRGPTSSWSAPVRAGSTRRVPTWPPPRFWTSCWLEKVAVPAGEGVRRRASPPAAAVKQAGQDGHRHPRPRVTAGCTTRAWRVGRRGDPDGAGLARAVQLFPS